MARPNMPSPQVLFLAGSKHLASTQIRCVDIARRLGCDFLFNKKYAYEIPDKYTVFVCVKPNLWPGELAELASRGQVIWDIIDTPPPRKHIHTYLASTARARDIFQAYGRFKIIPHHHCNHAGIPAPSKNRRPGWIGSRHWLPDLKGFAYDAYDIANMQRPAVVAVHRKIGIGLNFRRKRSPVFAPAHQRLLGRFHVEINSGIKLINCLGFGTPSISEREPAYLEIAPDCTLFSTAQKCAQWVRALQSDDALYLHYRAQCLEKAAAYHIDAIGEKYRKLFASLKG